MDEIDLHTVELGHAFTHRERLNHFLAIWGGVAWPGKRRGCAVVVGMDYRPHFDSHDIYLLDEYESFDMRKLIRQCGAMHVQYGIGLSRTYSPDSPGRWIGDYKNDAASRFIEEMNAEQNRDGSAPGREPFSLSRTPLLGSESLYACILAQIKDLLAPEWRQLFLKGGKILSYMSEIEEGQIAALELGDYPTIEALAFAVIELRQAIAQKERTAHIPEGDPWGHDNPINYGRGSGDPWR